jgi:hypothetical protein
MKQYSRMSNYPVGSQIETRNGYVRVKIAPNKWQGLGAKLLTEAGVELVPGDRVFFADGDRTNRKLENLRRIHFNATPFVLLPHSRPIYIPSKVISSFKETKNLLSHKVKLS